MSDIKSIIANNLSELRKAKKLTQGELAEKFNYTDKSISKWEHAETLPDIEVLYNLCLFYGVNLDYLVSEHQQVEIGKNQLVNNNYENIKHLIITCLASSIAWLVATLVFVTTLIYTNGEIGYWMAFVWAVPVNAIIAVVFNGVWGKRKFSFAITSILVWSFLTAIYLEMLIDTNYSLNLWMLFLLGAPLQASIILWSTLKSSRIRKKLS